MQTNSIRANVAALVNEFLTILSDEDGDGQAGHAITQCRLNAEDYLKDTGLYRTQAAEMVEAAWQRALAIVVADNNPMLPCPFCGNAPGNNTIAAWAKRP